MRFLLSCSRYRQAVLHKELVGPKSDQFLGGMKHARARSFEDDSEAATTVTSRVFRRIPSRNARDVCAGGSPRCGLCAAAETARISSSSTQEAGAGTRCGGTSPQLPSSRSDLGIRQAANSKTAYRIRMRPGITIPLHLNEYASSLVMGFHCLFLPFSCGRSCIRSLLALGPTNS
jgi:hypothetical protein